ATMRVDYARTDELDVGDLAATWHEQLTRWMDEAITDGVVEPNAMGLATTDEDGKPPSRTVLCKALDARALASFTNYTSAKSHQLRATRYASATFPWYAQHRQVHVRGHVELVTPEENAAYWATRPRGAQLGAWASAQSTEVRDRRVLDDALATITQRFAHEEKVPPPPHWGGWRILPEQVEAWQGRQDRTPDPPRAQHGPPRRAWRIRRLAP